MGSANSLRGIDMTRRVCHFLLLFLAVAGFIVLFAVPGFSQDEEGCTIGILKQVSTGQNIEFEFLENLNGVESPLIITSNNGVGIDIGVGDVLILTEVATDGWVLEDKQCPLSRNVLITEVENGFQFECLADGGALCGLFNRISADKIPTLSEWGMISAAVGLGLIGVFFAARRKRVMDQI